MYALFPHVFLIMFLHQIICHTPSIDVEHWSVLVPCAQLIQNVLHRLYRNLFYHKENDGFLVGWNKKLVFFFYKLVQRKTYYHELVLCVCLRNLKQHIFYHNLEIHIQKLLVCDFLNHDLIDWNLY